MQKKKKKNNTGQGKRGEIWFPPISNTQVRDSSISHSHHMRMFSPCLSLTLRQTQPSSEGPDPCFTEHPSPAEGKEILLSTCIQNRKPGKRRGQRLCFPCCKGYVIAASPGATNNGAAMAPGQPAINAHTLPPDSGDGARFRRKPGPETCS